MTFERDTLEGSITKGICYLSPVTHVPRDIPFTKDYEHFILEEPVEFLKPKLAPVSILLISNACK